MFGGSLEDYYEATLEPLPPVVESCIRTLKALCTHIYGTTTSKREKYILFVLCLIKKFLMSTVVQLFGMEQTGIFRIGGSHADITKFEESFERGEDPFKHLKNGNQINSVAGVLKSYFRKLSSPLFSAACFDQVGNSSRSMLTPMHLKPVKSMIHDIDVKTLPRSSWRWYGTTRRPTSCRFGRSRKSSWDPEQSSWGR